MGKRKVRRPLGRPRHRWEDIKMDLKEIEWEVVDWNYLPQDEARLRAVVNVVMNRQVPLSAGNGTR